MRFDVPSQTTPRDDDLSSTPSVSRLWQALRRDIGAALSERLDLLTLELQQARDRLPRLVIWMVLGVLMGLAGWLALWAALATWLAGIVGLVVALAVVGALNLVVAALIARHAITLLSQVGLPETMAHLRLRPERPTDQSTAAGDARLHLAEGS